MNDFTYQFYWSDGHYDTIQANDEQEALALVVYNENELISWEESEIPNLSFKNNKWE